MLLHLSRSKCLNDRLNYRSTIIVNETITTLATEPSDEEWRCIREFKRRTRELAENSLLRNGYDLSANMSWKAGEPPSFTVKASRTR